MRKFLLMAIAGAALGFAAPVGASAMTISPDAIKAATEGFSPEAQVAWHCRSWSGWCRGRNHRWRHPHWRRPHHRHHRHGHHRRHR